MANSSEWLTAVGAMSDDAAPQPGWLALCAEPGEFREALPFVLPFRDAPTPPTSSPEPEPAPAAEDALALARAEGEAVGRAAAFAETQAAAARQRSLRLAFRSLDETAAAILAQDLADTVITLCEGVLERHAADREALLDRCRAAAARIGGAASGLQLHLNPDDIAALDPEALAGWGVIADSALEPGALLLEGADGTVRDGPADWRRAIAEAVRGC